MPWSVVACVVASSVGGLQMTPVAQAVQAIKTTNCRNCGAPVVHPLMNYQGPTCCSYCKSEQ